MRTGRCLCGAVQYRVAGPVRDVLVCHCHECRRWAGRAWAAAAARLQDFEVTDGRGLRWIDSPASAASARRGFCDECGASLFWQSPTRDTISFSPGTLDDAGDLALVAHIWLEQAVPWERPADGLPGYARGYPATAPALRWVSLDGS